MIEIKQLLPVSPGTWRVDSPTGINTTSIDEMSIDFWPVVMYALVHQHKGTKNKESSEIWALTSNDLDSRGTLMDVEFPESYSLHQSREEARKCAISTLARYAYIRTQSADGM